MRRIAAAVIVLVASLASFGCASPAQIREVGNEHLAKAQELDATGYHYQASKEREKADKEFAKANAREYR
jgi:hypothetical protein